jgi:hypothetical protein
MSAKKDVEHMNRFELMNELERVRKFDRTDDLSRELRSLQDENHKLNQEVNRLLSQQVIVAQYFDVLGQKPGMEMWLDVADDLRTGRLGLPSVFASRAKRVKERRTQAQGRRKPTSRRKRT